MVTEGWIEISYPKNNKKLEYVLGLVLRRNDII